MEMKQIREIMGVQEDYEIREMSKAIWEMRETRQTREMRESMEMMGMRQINQGKKVK